MTLEKRTMGQTGLAVTRIGLGALEIGRDWGVGGPDSRTRPEAEAAAGLLHAALDAGINLVDTARAYHRSEERIGAAIARRRAEYVLASKCGEHSDEPRTSYDFSYGAILGSIDTSLRLLQTDVIDLMQIHFGPEPARVLDDGETVRAMRDAREAGKVRFLGASAPYELLDRCILSGDFDVLQVSYSLIDQAAGDLIAKAADRGIGVLIRSGFGGGWLTSRALQVAPEDRPERVRRLLDLVSGDAGALHALALAFLKQHPGITSILAGSKSIDHVRHNIALFEQPVDPDLLARAVEVAA